MWFRNQGVSIVLGIALLAGVFLGGFYTGQTRLVREEDNLISTLGFRRPADIDISEFWEVWSALDEQFVGSPNQERPSNDERVWSAIQGLAASFGDPYTVFLPPAQNELFEADISGNFGGVGMEIGINEDVLTVIAPLPDTPAERAGIQTGDVIAAVDGESTVSMSVDEAVLRIRGEVGTTVVLTLFRDSTDELFDVEVVRGVIAIPTISTELLPSGVFVIALFNFSATAPDEFRLALREFLLSGSDKLIVDLRGNPGGFLQSSVEIASWFTPLGKPIVHEEGGGESSVHRSRGYNIYNGQFGMVVLVNEGSASASEIVAGALRDYDIATLVGAQTFGKGSVQELVDIGEESALRLTVAHWFTPSGESISEDGLTPDVVVEVTREDIEQGRDPQLEKAVEILLAS